ncbi:hypothetical protein HED50_22780 [Ochrobactrum oryzae]|nr:hypothetical protein [Brucella oryzae]
MSAKTARLSSDCPVYRGYGQRRTEKIVQDWARGDIDFVVATSAFGMGVDKANVRTVIHACLPESPSRYYQEIGRAARDGHQGLAIVLFTDTDGKALDDVKSAFSQATGSWLTRKGRTEMEEPLS